jgi:hypothetical protein
VRLQQAGQRSFRIAMKKSALAALAYGLDYPGLAHAVMNQYPQYNPDDCRNNIAVDDRKQSDWRGADHS